MKNRMHLVMDGQIVPVSTKTEGLVYRIKLDQNPNDEPFGLCSFILASE
jgi:hypothetical protein